MPEQMGTPSESSLAHNIAANLRRQILLEKLLPGAPIKERDSAADLGVSRTPMREAIRILAQEGLVVLRPSRSPVVADPSLKDVTDDLDVIRALEVLSAELACKNASDAEIEEIRAIHEKLVAEFDTASKVDLFEIDMAFHQSIARASGNGALAETHGAYLSRLWRARYLSASQRRNRERVVRQHGAIMDALLTRDAARSKREVDSHLGSFADHIAASFDTTPGGVD